MSSTKYAIHTVIIAMIIAGGLLRQVDARLKIGIVERSDEERGTGFSQQILYAKSGPLK